MPKWPMKLNNRLDLQMLLVFEKQTEINIIKLLELPMVLKNLVCLALDILNLDELKLLHLKDQPGPIGYLRVENL